MPRRIGRWLMFGAAAAALTRVGWPGAPTGLGTVIRRVDVIAIVVMLAVLPWLARRVFGPAASGALARVVRVVRVGGYAVVFTLVLAKAEVERFEYAAPFRRPSPAALWTGEIVFLVVMAAYVAGILAATARRARIGPAALAVGTRAGLAVGLIMYVLPPLGSLLHVASGWPASGYQAARVLALLLVLGLVTRAGLTAARRTSGRGSKLPLADVRARQGVAAGLCAGAAAALVVSVLGISTIALVPHELNGLQWALTSPHLAPGAVYRFEMGLSDTAAGHLLVLVFFPLLSAGLGAWGGLYASGRRGDRPGGGGGGGHPPPAPTPPSGGGRRLDGDRRPAILRGGYLVELPVREGLSPAPEDEQAAPGHPGRIPVGRVDDL